MGVYLGSCILGNRGTLRKLAGNKGSRPVIFLLSYPLWSHSRSLLSWCFSFLGCSLVLLSHTYSRRKTSDLFTVSAFCRISEDSEFVDTTLPSVAGGRWCTAKINSSCVIQEQRILTFCQKKIKMNMYRKKGNSSGGVA